MPRAPAGTYGGNATSPSSRAASVTGIVSSYTFAPFSTPVSVALAVAAIRLRFLRWSRGATDAPTGFSTRFGTLNSSMSTSASALGTGAWAPVPVSETFSLACAGSLLAIAKQPESVAAAVGAYVVVSVTLSPGATVNGAAGETENAAGVPSHREIPVTSSAPFPVFRTCVVREAVLPTVTVPKSSAGGFDRD